MSAVRELESYGMRPTLIVLLPNMKSVILYKGQAFYAEDAWQWFRDLGADLSYVEYVLENVTTDPPFCYDPSDILELSKEELESLSEVVDLYELLPGLYPPDTSGSTDYE